MPTRLDFTVNLGDGSHPTPRRQHGAFNLLIISNFFGTTERSTEPVAVSIDTLDAVIRRFHPQLDVETSDNGPVAVEIRELEDLHPDRLIEQLPQFAALLDMRRRLSDPATYQDAARELARAEPAPAEAPADTSAQPEDQSTFERLLGGSIPAADPNAASAGSDTKIQRLISDIIAPHLQPGVDDRQHQLVAAVDDSLARLLRQVLHDARFQALESVWRSVHWLLSNIYDDDLIKVSILDSGSDALSDKAIESLRDRAAMPGANDWSLVICDIDIGATKQSFEAARQAAKLGAVLNTPILAGASARLIGTDDFSADCDAISGLPLDADIEQAWQDLRTAANSQFLGAALPRFLLRQPYGKKSDEIDRFAFEELSPRPAHDTFLWGNSAFACARLITDAYQEFEWDFASALATELDDLPLVVFDDGTGQALKPVAECLMPESAADTLLAAGLIAVQSYRDANRMRVMPMRSIQGTNLFD